MSKTFALHWLVPLIALLALISAGAGLFVSGGDGPLTFTNVYGQVVELYGRGLYRHDSLLAGAGFRGVDTVTLFLAIPLLLAAFLWLLVTLIAVLMYAGEFIRASLTLILLAIPLATINGLCEEILWRGLYVRLFPRNPWLAILVPSLGFALWHLAPQTIFPAENVPPFVLSTFFLSLPYGYIAYRTGSAKWTAISHSLSGILALSGYLAPSTMALLSS